MIFKVILISCCAILAVNAGYSTPNCPNLNDNYRSTAYDNRLSPITTVNGQTYTTNGGFFAASSAEQCCLNCWKYTNGLCTTWTYDGCGTCYLSSAK